MVPMDTLANAKRLLDEACTMLKALGEDWHHDFALVAKSKIAEEHVHAARDVLGQTEELLRVREQPAAVSAPTTGVRRTAGAPRL